MPTIFITSGGFKMAAAGNFATDEDNNNCVYDILFGSDSDSEFDGFDFYEVEMEISLAVFGMFSK